MAFVTTPIPINLTHPHPHHSHYHLHHHQHHHYQDNNHHHHSLLNTTTPTYPTTPNNNNDNNDNNNTTSDGDYIYDYDLSVSSLPLEELIVNAVGYGLVLLLGLVGNVLVVVSVARYRRMHNVTNIFLLSLATADLLLVCICVPVKSNTTDGLQHQERNRDQTKKLSASHSSSQQLITNSAHSAALQGYLWTKSIH
ncbi:hypothetical protein ACOMHN_036435 [Nucella lapillus]